ncbi:MAG TPA: OmpA family protein, partial [Acetobacteraceae bacterium]
RFMVIGLGLLLSACAGMGSAPGKYLVFFQDWSANLGPEAQTTIDHAASQAKAAPAGSVVVTGYADPAGSAQSNRDISSLRAEVVANALVAAGVPVGRIQRRAAGSVGFASDSQESRRVEIAIGG